MSQPSITSVVDYIDHANNDEDLMEVMLSLATRTEERSHEKEQASEDAHAVADTFHNI